MIPLKLTQRGLPSSSKMYGLSHGGGILTCIEERVAFNYNNSIYNHTAIPPDPLMHLNLPGLRSEYVATRESYSGI